MSIISQSKEIVRKRKIRQGSGVLLLSKNVSRRPLSTVLGLGLKYIVYLSPLQGRIDQDEIERCVERRRKRERDKERRREKIDKEKD